MVNSITTRLHKVYGIRGKVRYNQRNLMAHEKVKPHLKVAWVGTACTPPISVMTEEKEAIRDCQMF